jgi:hypothetical protein
VSYELFVALSGSFLDLVFIRFHPYQNSSLHKSGEENLKPHFYGPYRVIRRVGEVAYTLELPEGIIIHVLHVVCLKKALGQHLTTSTDHPPLYEEGKLVLSPERIVDVQERRLRSYFLS